MYIGICSDHIRYLYIYSEMISTTKHSNIAEEKMNKICILMYGIRYANIL